ncbi:MAG TPA: tripartite tricarboxylate transporter TctB family protein, partial [Chloroflexota bacterium]|nr:tripartite tricarboxylate transporter TctB family protein [Chloroflexota bacterium]
MFIRSRTGDLVSGVIALLLGVFYLYEGTHYRLWTAGGNPGGGFLPTVLGGSMVLLSVVLITKTLRAQPSEGGTVEVSFNKPLLVLGALAFYVVLLPFLGYLLASTVVTAFLLFTFDDGDSRRRVVKSVVVSVAVVAIFYVVFVQVEHPQQQGDDAAHQVTSSAPDKHELPPIPIRMAASAR